MAEDSQNLTHRDDLSFDPERWDPDEEPDECQVCGTSLMGAGDGSTVGEYCPECGVHVWIR